MQDIVFCSMAVDEESLGQVRTLLASLREFGGAMAESPFVIMVPQGDPTLRSRWGTDPNVQVVPFDWAPGDAAFPFTRKLAAGAAAEAHLDGGAELVVWMSPETLILREPKAFKLAPGKVMGGRPVDVMLIGPEWGAPPDPFWQAIFGGSQIPEARFFQVATSIERIPLRNHLNAGLIVVRPERGILRAWWADFLRLYREPIFLEYYRKGDNYTLLMHQAVLAGTALRLTAPQEVEVFPDLVSYPLHLHDQYPANIRPRWMDELTSARYYLDYDSECLWRLPSQEPLKSWLIRALGA